MFGKNKNAAPVVNQGDEQVELTLQDLDIIMQVINKATISGSSAETIAVLKQKIVRKARIMQAAGVPGNGSAEKKEPGEGNKEGKE